MNKKDYSEFALFFEFLGSDPFAESEKGIIISGVAFIEESLKRLLKKRLIDEDERIDNLRHEILINLSYSTGAISKKIKEDLSILRIIRNKVAHYSKNKINRKWIFSKLNNLNCKVVAPMDKLPKKEKYYRTFYLFAINFYLGILNSEIPKVNKDKCLRIPGEKIE